MPGISKPTVALAILLSLTVRASAADRLSNDQIIRGFVNLGRISQLAFAMKYRLAQYGNLDIGATTHTRAVALGLLDAEMIDPWGTPYRLEIDGQRFRVTGAGADRKFESQPSPLASINADLMHDDREFVRNNYSWLFEQVGEPPSWMPRLYAVPSFEPLHRRQPERMPATPDDARTFEMRMEHPWVFLRYGNFDVLRSVKTRAALELLAARLDAWREKHGALTALEGNSLAVILNEPWPFNEWLRPHDEWGTPIRVDVTGDGKSYRIASAGADKQFDTDRVDAASPAIDIVLYDGTITSMLDVNAYETALRTAEEERDRQTLAKLSAAPVKARDGSMAWWVGGDVTPPEALKRVDPVYPDVLRREGVGGLCIVEYIVDENGNVAHAVAIFGKSPELNQAAVDAVLQWKFKPAMREGKPVRSIAKLTFMMRPK